MLVNQKLKASLMTLILTVGKMANLSLRIALLLPRMLGFSSISHLVQMIFFFELYFLMLYGMHYGKKPSYMLKIQMHMVAHLVCMLEQF